MLTGLISNVAICRTFRPANKSELTFDTWLIIQLKFKYSRRCKFNIGQERMSNNRLVSRGVGRLLQLFTSIGGQGRRPLKLPLSTPALLLSILYAGGWNVAKFEHLMANGIWVVVKVVVVDCADCENRPVASRNRWSWSSAWGYRSTWAGSYVSTCSGQGVFLYLAIFNCLVLVTSGRCLSYELVTIK